MIKKFASQTGSVLIPIMLAAAALAGIGMFAVQRFQGDMKSAKTVQIKNEYDTIMSDLKILLSSTDACSYTFQNWNPEDYLERPEVKIYSKQDAAHPPIERYKSNLDPALAPKYGASQIRIKYIKMGFRNDPSVGFPVPPGDPTQGYTNLLVGFYFGENRSLSTKVLEKKIRLQVKIASPVDRRITSCSFGGYVDMDDYLPLVGGRMRGDIIMADGTKIEMQSDRNFKYDVLPLGPVLPELLKVSPVSYQWINSGKSSYGFIAQDVQKIFPQLVHEHSYLTVDYIGFVPFLLKGLQELNEENIELKKTFNELNEEHEELKEYLCQTNKSAHFCRNDNPHFSE